jgi:anti-sigma factor RsiW
MSHPSEEDLVLYLYGEAADPESVQVHIESCSRCREDVALLRQVLAEVDEMTPPERPLDYGERVWERLSKELSRTRKPRPYTWLAAAAAILAAVFLAGRFTAGPSLEEDGDRARAGRIRERVLLVALSDHLEQSRMLLLEVVNRDDGSASIAPVERERAAELLQASRLYRQTAHQVGEVAAADVLEDLERILLDLSQGPGSMEARDGLRSRIEDRDLLFKLRVLGSTVKKF